MYEKELQEFGLTEGESKVYAYLLKAETSTVGPITKNSRVAYSNIYEILERLIQKGLVSYIIKEKTRYYNALPPTRLREYLEKKRLEIIDKESKLKNILPELQKLIKKHKERTAEIYIGINGLKTAYENFLENAKMDDSVLYFYSYDSETYKQTNQFYYRLFPKLKETRTLWKGIANIEFKEQFKKEKAPKFLEVRFVNFPVPSNIDIFNDKILITSWADIPMGILITSKEIADNFTNYFNKLWEITKK